MQIEFLNRARTRIVGELVWDAKNRHVVEVDDLELAAGLLTHVGFGVGDGEPMLGLDGVDKETVVGMVVAGVGSLEGLAGLDEVGIARLADELQANEARVLDWVEQARAMISPADNASSSDGEEE